MSGKAAGGQGTSALGLAAAADRIGARFDAAPTQYAAVLQALGELQFYLSDDVGALAALGRLLDRSDAIDPETLAVQRMRAGCWPRPSSSGTATAVAGPCG